MQVRLNSISIERRFNLEAETVFRPYLHSHYTGVTEICFMALLAHSLLAVEVRLKSGSNESLLTLETETVYRPYLLSHCRGVTEILNMVHSAHALETMQIRFKCVSDDRKFSLEAEKVFPSYFPSDCIGMAEINHMWLPAHLLCASQVWLKSVRYSSLSLSLHCRVVTEMLNLVLHKQRKYGRNRSVTKGTLLMRPEQFFTPLSPCTAAGWLKKDTMHSLQASLVEIGQ
jgi:hypothetical protein